MDKLVTKRKGIHNPQGGAILGSEHRSQLIEATFTWHVVRPPNFVVISSTNNMMWEQSLIKFLMEGLLSTRWTSLNPLDSTIIYLAFPNTSIKFTIVETQVFLLNPYVSNSNIAKQFSYWSKAFDFLWQLLVEYAMLHV